MVFIDCFFGLNKLSNLRLGDTLSHLERFASCSVKVNKNLVRYKLSVPLLRGRRTNHLATRAHDETLLIHHLHLPLERKTGYESSNGNETRNVE